MRISIHTFIWIFLCQRVYPISNTCHRVHISCTVIVQASFVIELFAIELIRQVFTAAMFINQQFAVRQVSIILSDIGMIVCDVRR